MRVLVTGASGFIGRHLSMSLSGMGHEIVAHVHDRPATLPAAVACEIFKAPLEELESFPSGIDVIVHTAGRSPARGYSDHDMIVSNVIGMDRLLRCAERSSVKMVVFLSSISIFGDVSVRQVNETVLPNAPDVYGTSKYLGERLLSSVAATLPSISLRLPGVLGAGAAFHWLARTADLLRANKPVTIVNPDAAFNNAVHVRDLGTLVDRVISADLKGSTVLTLGAAGSLSIRNVVLLLRERLRSESPIEVGVATRAPFTIDSEQASQRFGYRPMNLAEMLALYADEIQTSETAAAAKLEPAFP